MDKKHDAIGFQFIRTQKGFIAQEISSSHSAIKAKHMTWTEEEMQLISRKFSYVESDHKARIILLQFFKTEHGFKRQEVHASGKVLEGTYTEEEYGGNFLNEFKIFQKEKEIELDKKKEPAAKSTKFGI